ncbi:hypothetical protein [Desulfomonile tiedjei]|nr:hypothetical protein [Desulfomonile tiedjei]
MRNLLFAGTGFAPAGGVDYFFERTLVQVAETADMPTSALVS